MWAGCGRDLRGDKLQLSSRVTREHEITSLSVKTEVLMLVGSIQDSLEVVRPHCIVITTTPTFAYSLVQVPHKILMWYSHGVPAL